jgi:hypothetical protein
MVETQNLSHSVHESRHWFSYLRLERLGHNINDHHTAVSCCQKVHIIQHFPHIQHFKIPKDLNLTKLYTQQ